MLFRKKTNLAFYIMNVLVIICLLNEMAKVESRQNIDVKKFSLANKMMEDFLNNYQNLKNIYKSRETLHSYTSSFDIDKPYKVISEKQKSKQRNRYFKRKTFKYSTLHPVTAVIYESDASFDEMPNAVEKAKSASNEEQVVIFQKKSVEVKRKPEKINISKYNEDKDESVKDVYKEYGKSDEDVEEIALEMLPEKDIVLLKPTRNILNDNAIKELDKQSNYKIKHNVFGDKTRFNILRLTHDKISKSNVSKKLKRLEKNGNNTRRIQKIDHSEIYSPYNLWHEVINKPIKLIKVRDPFLEVQRSSFRNKNKDWITIIILNQDTEESFEQSRNDGLIESRTQNLLRSTYGDVCLQIPIKKCNKVIKTVNKSVCKLRFKCKSEFKSAFLENGKIGCEKEFSYKKSEQKINEQKHQSNENKTQPMLLRIIDGKRDKDRDVLLDKENKPEALLLKKALRDKYERECQKQSREKCISACEYATNVTCSTHSCQKGKSKAFKKVCKDECKTVFIINKGSDTESSENDSDSDSESDDESD